MTIAENLAQVQANIARAAEKAGRDPKDILLIGATKMNDADRVREAICAGLPACGENRVQELLEKHAQGAYEGARLHFIGSLQKNKVKYLVGLVELIHSVDSVELMREINKQALKRGITQDIGLMTIPPICQRPEENLPYFQLLRQLFIDNGEKKYDNVRMDFMSMGMSGDYEAAIACGANMVRVGTAIFGHRVYPAKS